MSILPILCICEKQESKRELIIRESKLSFHVSQFYETLD